MLLAIPPLASSGYDEENALARVQWTEYAPPTDLVTWLHNHLQYADVKIHVECSQTVGSAFNVECPGRCLPGTCDLCSVIPQPQCLGAR